MDIRIGIWAGGDKGNDEGTIEWAGGETDYDQGPFTMYLEKIEVVNDNPGGSYSYGDKTGDYTSIKVGDSDSDSDSSSSSSSSKASSSETSSSGSTASKDKATATALDSTASTATQSGMWWTASASAGLTQAATSPARRVSVEAWVFGVVGVVVAWGFV